MNRSLCCIGKRMSGALGMNTHTTTRNRSQQAGFVLVASLILMVVITLIGVAMFRGVSLQEKVAGNLRQKQVAFDIAQNTLIFGQNFLSPPPPATAPTAVACSNAAATIGQAPNTPVVCTKTSAYPPDEATLVAALSGGAAGTPYTPGGNAALTVNATGGANAVYALPRLSIQLIGNQAGTGNPLYRLTAVAWGGSKNSLAVVQSTFALGGGAGGAKDLGSL